jgi:hypothetical protein
VVSLSKVPWRDAGAAVGSTRIMANLIALVYNW